MEREWSEKYIIYKINNILNNGTKERNVVNKVKCRRLSEILNMIIV